MELKDLLQDIEVLQGDPTIGAASRSLAIAMIGIIRAESEETLSDEAVLRQIRAALALPGFRNQLIRKALYGPPDGARERLLSVLMDLGLTATPDGDDGGLEYTQPDAFLKTFADAASLLQSVCAAVD